MSRYHLTQCDVCGAEQKRGRVVGWIELRINTWTGGAETTTYLGDMCPSCIASCTIESVFEKLAKMRS